MFYVFGSLYDISFGFVIDLCNVIACLLICEVVYFLFGDFEARIATFCVDFLCMTVMFMLAVKFLSSCCSIDLVHGD